MGQLQSFVREKLAAARAAVVREHDGERGQGGGGGAAAGDSEGPPEQRAFLSDGAPLLEFDPSTHLYSVAGTEDSGFEFRPRGEEDGAGGSDDEGAAPARDSDLLLDVSCPWKLASALVRLALCKRLAPGVAGGGDDRGRGDASAAPAGSDGDRAYIHLRRR